LAEARIEVDTIADGVRIRTRYPDRDQTFTDEGSRRYNNPATVEYSLTIPRQARLESISGTVPSLLNPPPGCRFAARCKYAMDICTQGVPPLKEVAPGHRVACVL